MIYIVVKLFNAIQQSHATAAAAAEDAKAGRGTGKPTLAAPTFEKKGKAKGKNKDNVLGREKERTSSIFYITLSDYESLLQRRLVGMTSLI
jgi:hypothetical protein